MAEKEKSRQKQESPLEEAARLMNDFKANLIDGRAFAESVAKVDKDQASSILIDSFYLQNLAKGILAVYLQQEEILRRLPHYDGGRRA